MPPQAPVYRVAGNLRTLATLWIVYGVLHMIPGLFLRSFLGFFGPRLDVPFFFPGVIHAITGLLIAKGLIAAVAGWGLLERQGWARILAIVLAFLSLLHFPFGTALGIYTLWVLLPSTSEMEYRQMARS
jgi:uncharacterized membrane protein (DUF2068 family)